MGIFGRRRLRQELVSSRRDRPGGAQTRVGFNPIFLSGGRNGGA